MGRLEMLAKQILRAEPRTIWSSTTIDDMVGEGLLEPLESSHRTICDLLNPQNDWRVLVEFIGACIDYKVSLDYPPIKEALELLLEHDEAYVRIAASRGLARCFKTEDNKTEEEIT